jgi:hypothetical protein
VTTRLRAMRFGAQPSRERLAGLPAIARRRRTGFVPNGKDLPADLPARTLQQLLLEKNPPTPPPDLRPPGGCDCFNVLHKCRFHIVHRGSVKIARAVRRLVEVVGAALLGLALIGTWIVIRDSAVVRRLVGSDPSVPTAKEEDAKPGPVAIGVLRLTTPAHQPRKTSATPADEIGELLVRYKKAFEIRSLDEVKRIWPTLRTPFQEAIDREFRGSSRIGVDLLDPHVQVSGSIGTVRVVRRYDVLLAHGPRLHSDSYMVLTVKAHDDGVWLIDSVRFEPISDPLVVEIHKP